MKLFDELMGRAAAADAAMADMAKRGFANEARRQAIQKLDDDLRRMASDGFLDPDEVAALSAQAEALGIDLSLPSKNGSRLVPGDLEGARDAIDEAYDATHDFGFEYEVQRLVSEHQESVTAASKVSKAEHEMYMAAIRNLRA